MCDDMLQQNKMYIRKKNVNFFFIIVHYNYWMMIQLSDELVCGNCCVGKISTGNMSHKRSFRNFCYYNTLFVQSHPMLFFQVSIRVIFFAPSLSSISILQPCHHFMITCLHNLSHFTMQSRGSLHKHRIKQIIGYDYPQMIRYDYRTMGENYPVT